MDWAKSSNVNGQFEPATWTLRLGLHLKTQTTFSAKECEDLSATIYHEMRHAEQVYSMAYCLCRDGKADQEIQKMLRIPLKVITTARSKAQLPIDLALYNFGKKMYTGEHGNFDANQKKSLWSFLTAHRSDKNTKDRAIATRECHEAADYCEKVSNEIDAYNKVRPTNVPARNSTEETEGAAFKLGTCWAELDKAFKKFDKDKSEPNENAFYNAYHMYLAAKKPYALSRWRKAYEKYILTTLEDDAHSVQAHLMARFPDVDRGGKYEVTDPVRYRPTPQSVRRLGVKAF